MRGEEVECVDEDDVEWGDLRLSSCCELSKWCGGCQVSQGHLLPTIK